MGDPFFTLTPFSQGEIYSGEGEVPRYAVRSGPGAPGCGVVFPVNHGCFAITTP